MKDNDKAFMDKVVDFYYSTVDDSHPQGNMSEVAEHFGISESRVKSILFRMRSRLKQHLHNECFSV